MLLNTASTVWVKEIVLWGKVKVYAQPVSVSGAQSRKNAAIAPKWFNSLDTNFRFILIFFTLVTRTPDCKD
jgi:hypothetical protein